MKTLGPRRRNRRTACAGALGRNKSSERLIADRRIDDRRPLSDEKREPRLAGRATRPVPFGFRLMTIAIVSGRYRFCLRAAARLFDFRGSLARNCGKSDRAGESQAEQESKHSSHRGIVCTFGGSGSTNVCDAPDNERLRGITEMKKIRESQCRTQALFFHSPNRSRRIE